MELKDHHYIILLGVRDHVTVRDMGNIIDRSIGTIQQLEKDLLDWGLIKKKDPTKRKTAPYTLTRDGIEELRNHGYNVLA